MSFLPRYKIKIPLVGILYFVLDMNDKRSSPTRRNAVKVTWTLQNDPNLIRNKYDIEQREIHFYAINTQIIEG
jgi:hypothetical protein